ncbi:hypothetical protein PCANC_23295 [Puccinia coronata f. sp. avenae]|uniref:Uncharacterized protein n=1 Tax=Puccinia coronata f. sp. avenae TaxID=200324 RepID=A0A2N5TMV3_9BASI|nr:hypothetical protein PCANC_23295 [Puccinia coronata f. sp. avenae]PLW27581.1 hypothetical protein PCASD_20090 [Puccinia coronata f. sp. avenae]
MKITGFTVTAIFFSVLANITAKQPRILGNAWTTEKPFDLDSETWLGYYNNASGAKVKGPSHIFGTRGTDSRLEMTYLRNNDIHLYNGSKRKQAYTIFECHLSEGKVSTERRFQYIIEPNRKQSANQSTDLAKQSLFT